MLLLATLLLSPGPSRAEALRGAEVDAFIARMAQEHGFAPGQLRAVLSRARIEQRILDAISRPAEAKPWHEYRRIFLTPARMEQGVAFARRHAGLLEQAERRWGVPPEVITAIIGVETFYGRHTGGYRVIDALSTLAFAYPPRSGFFRRELEQFLLLTRDAGLDPLQPTGSYAGAMGIPQFMPSSYRSYAVDFDGDGVADIWQDPGDAIASVANYLGRHGWRRGGPVAVPVRGVPPQAVLDRGLEPHTPLSRLRLLGISPDREVPGDPEAAVIALQQPDHLEYWFGFRNFHVITRYNRSPLYAMAVWQLAERIREGLGR
ncbi:MAG: lytic murein transglycosylase B [Gammaproteobacteria bacterium]|nr:MAG: lytic murein transglycosylase B [Gammaproteobacteria bacterium]